MWPDKPELHVSHETIYTAIYAHPKGELRKDLIACLRQSPSRRSETSSKGPLKWLRPRIH